MCDCSQLVTGLYHKGIEQEKIFSLSFIFTIFVHFPSNLSYSVPQQNNSDTNFEDESTRVLQIGQTVYFSLPQPDAS